MRMTNKIMRNNSLYNINQNKILEDKLTNQMTNQSKITRPSDDPVVAIRALRLRTNVTTISQYYDKNAKDADQWLTLTADALTTIDEVLRNMREETSSAANKDLTADDLEIYLTQMKSLTKEFYSSGNVDYAGRYIFSGFRTDTAITFSAEDVAQMKKHPVSYEIKENFKYSDIDTINYTDYSVLSGTIGGAGDGGVDSTTNTSYEQGIKNNTLYRIRLSYDEVGGVVYEGGTGLTKSLFISTIPSLPVRVENYGVSFDGGDNMREIYGPSYGQGFVDKNGESLKTDDNGNLVYNNNPPTRVTDDAGNLLDEEGQYVKDLNGNNVKLVQNGNVVSLSPSPYISYKVYDDPEEAYKAVADGKAGVGGTTGVAFIPSTGELIFNDNYYNAIQENSAFEITYNKSSWVEGDINPAHYFECYETKDMGNGETKKTAYNTTTKNQDIYYDVGFNQKIQVNTVATEVFHHDARRDMDDFQHCLTQLRDIETEISDIKKKRDEFAEDSDDYANWTKKLEGAEKAQTYIRESIHTKFENQITKYQNYMDDNNLAITSNATRGSRLDLVNVRLMNQKATFKDLQTDNEGIDVTQVAVELSSSELTYQAALMATGKIMQTNLMNYI